MKNFQKVSQKLSQKQATKPSDKREINFVTFSGQEDGEETALNNVEKHFSKLGYGSLFDKYTIYQYITHDGYQIFFGTGAELLFNNAHAILDDNVDSAGDIFYLKVDDFDGVKTAGQLAEELITSAVRNDREYEIYGHIDKLKDRAFNGIIRNLVKELYHNLDGSGQQYEIFNGIVCASINSGSYLPYNPVNDKYL